MLNMLLYCIRYKADPTMPDNRLAQVHSICLEVKYRTQYGYGTWLLPLLALLNIWLLSPLVVLGRSGHIPLYGAPLGLFSVPILSTPVSCWCSFNSDSQACAVLCTHGALVRVLCPYCDACCRPTDCCALLMGTRLKTALLYPVSPLFAISGLPTNKACLCSL